MDWFSSGGHQNCVECYNEGSAIHFSNFYISSTSHTAYEAKSALCEAYRLLCLCSVEMVAAAVSKSKKNAAEAEIDKTWTDPMQ